MAHSTLVTRLRLHGLTLTPGSNVCRVTMCFGLGLGIGQGQPLLGASQRVARGDEAYIRVLREIDVCQNLEIKKFVDPLYMAQYYTNEGRLAAKGIGFSCGLATRIHNNNAYVRRSLLSGNTKT